MRYLLVVFSWTLIAFAGVDQDWAAMEKLKGEWLGVGTGKPGEATGSFSFLPEMKGKIYVRRNRADYPETKGRPAFSHEDFMTIYRAGETVRADFVDNEGHVIRYIVTASDQAVEFLSVSDTMGPRYRIQYLLEGDGKMKLRFDVAPPGKLDQFTNYVEAELRRK